MEAPLSSPPPDPPELPAGAQRFPAWPPWFSIAGFLVGTAITLLVSGIVIAVAGADPEADSPALTVVNTLVLGLAFVGTALFFANLVTRPRAWHFGLRGARLWPSVGWAALGLFTFYLLTALYSVLVKPDAEQGTVEALGGDEGTIGLIVAGLMVIAVAPVVEEFFFRGFFYRALRTRFSVWLAATIDGVVFGLIHYDFELGAEGLLLLPPLALLGLIFCLVYERTGSLFPVIGMHAFNNAVAYAAQADGGWQVSVVAGPLAIAACIAAPRLLPRAPRPATA